MSSKEESNPSDVQCLVCGKGEQDCEGNLLKSSMCKWARYCSKDCQVAHWPTHKHECGPPIVEEFWKFVEKAKKEDYAITEDEYKWMPWAVNRFAGYLNTREGIGGQNPEENMKRAVLYFLDRRLLNKGRGVRLVNLPKSKKRHEGSIGYITSAKGGQAGPTRSYQVKLGSGGMTLTVKPSQMHMVPLNDPRHWAHALEYNANPDKVFPPSADAEWCNRQRQYIPVTQGYKWEYKDVDGQWKEYNEFIQYAIETLYDMGGEHFLYRPGAPHCEGMPMSEGGQTSTDANLPFAGDVVHLNPHDASSRQVVFKEDQRAIMTERDLFTGMRRQVRRSGPLVPTENNYMHRRGFYGQGHHVMDNSTNKGTFCGLCDSTKGPFVQTECCGKWVCDTENQYQVGSYEREGQCARNHRYGSICAWHHQEGHTGDDWKDCQLCQDDFHPFDYAVKASSQADSGTMRRYNFDDNGRHDLDLSQVEFPTCDECKAPIDTTEETTRTIMFRQIQAGGKAFCIYHGGGFGRIKTDASFYSNLQAG